jgi:hypothetical protein
MAPVEALYPTSTTTTTTAAKPASPSAAKPALFSSAAKPASFFYHSGLSRIIILLQRPSPHSLTISGRARFDFVSGQARIVFYHSGLAASLSYYSGQARIVLSSAAEPASTSLAAKPAYSFCISYQDYCPCGWKENAHFQPSSSLLSFSIPLFIFTFFPFLLLPTCSAQAIKVTTRAGVEENYPTLLLHLLPFLSFSISLLIIIIFFPF